MAVVVVCPKCSKQLKINEQQIGKRAKCPNCKEVLTLQPAEASSSGSGKGAAGQKAEWRVMTGENEEFGPVTKAELDAWMEDGRLDSECQLLKDGWDQWQWADEVYPQLAEPNSPETPTLQLSTAPTLSIHTAGTSLPPAGSSPAVLPLPGSGGASLPSPAPLGGSPMVAGLPTAPLGGVAPATTTSSPAGIASPPNAIAPSAAGEISADDLAIPSGAEVSRGVIQSLKNTQNWVLVFVALTAISLLLGGLGLLAWTILAILAAGIRGMLSTLFFVVPVMVQGVFAWLLYNYYVKIGEFVGRPTLAHLQKALEAQQQFWMVSAITVLVVIGLQILAALLGYLLLGGLLWSLH